MEKRYQVFVSSTYDDLREERQHVIQALLELDCIPAGMELFPAADDDQWTFIKRVIDDCDYYLVIIAGRYGSTDKDGMSYTEKEYDYAVAQGKPVIGFYHEDPGKISAEKCDDDPDKKSRLETFREKVKRRICKPWKTPEDLSGKVSRSIANLKKQNPAEGWVKARYASDPERIVQLHNRIDQLERELKAARTQPPDGIEGLAQGNDSYLIRFDLFETLDPIEQAIGKSPPKIISTTRGSNWDELFCLLGPSMLEECSEHGLRSRLEDWLWPVLDASTAINEDDFHQIIIQLLALGLIQRSKKRNRSRGHGEDQEIAN